MLKQLKISNIILVESAEIHFKPGLNILSGETGSGKSAIMEAINLLLGARADTGVIRKGADKGVVEASFTGSAQVFELAGIDLTDEDLVIRRELYATGKSRALINHQSVSLATLREVGENLVEMVGQHANQRLLNLDQHRSTLDVFGDIDSLTFKNSYSKELDLVKQLESLKSEEAQRLRQIEICKMEIQELQEAKLKSGEDEELFAEFTHLASAEERSQKVQELNKALNAVGTFNRAIPLFEQLESMDSELKDVFQAFKSAIIELDDVAHSMRHYESRIDFSPERLQQMDERLSFINKLKRKYGQSIEEILTYLHLTEERLAQLENADHEIENLENALSLLRKTNDDLALKLTAERKKIAFKLTEGIIQELHSLNMPKASFEIEVLPQKRQVHGDDRVEFFLVPNVGENRVSIRECASGGELSRIMLALQALLAGKDGVTTIVFDEIDANIGGSTANVVGEKLKQIGQNHQVLCITHFAQVAKYADSHLQISKKEIEGRTITTIQLLNAQGKKAEILRMQGLQA